MGLIAKDIPLLIQMLLPGFISAGVFYTLTAHPKLSEFERLIQALIFTSILRFLSISLRAVFLFAGSYLGTLGIWTENVDLGWSVCLAPFLGILFAYGANTDRFHKFLRWARITKRTSYPSEWYSAFSLHARYVILHLSDGRRLFGWPNEWPDQPDRGHFLLSSPEWLLDDNRREPLPEGARFLIPAVDVKMVELLEFQERNQGGSSEIRRPESPPIDTQEASTDGSQDTATGTESPIVE